MTCFSIISDTWERQRWFTAVMAAIATVPNYTPSIWVRLCHAIPRLDLTLQTRDSVFTPDSWEYQQVTLSLSFPARSLLPYPLLVSHFQKQFLHLTAGGGCAHHSEWRIYFRLALYFLSFVCTLSFCLNYIRYMQYSVWTVRNVFFSHNVPLLIALLYSNTDS